MKRGSFRQITNVSLWETIPRSLATTFITLLPILSLLVFGGADAERLCLRAPHRHRLGRVLVDLRRGPAARLDQGAGARVGAAQARGRGRDPVGRRHGARGQRRRWPRRRRSCSRPSRRRPLRCRRPRRQPRPPASAVAPAAPRGPTAAPASAKTATAYTLPMDGNGRAQLRAAHRSSSFCSPASAGSRSPPRRGRHRGRSRPACRRRARAHARGRPGAFASWRRDAEQTGRCPSEASDRAFKRLGLVRREEADDLALRLAQLEHRLRLLETPEPSTAAAGPRRGVPARMGPWRRR